MIDGDWKVALYLDERADDAQAECLERIFTGSPTPPGWRSVLAIAAGCALALRPLSVLLR